jgi:hypothetical protein
VGVMLMMDVDSE